MKSLPSENASFFSEVSRLIGERHQIFNRELALIQRKWTPDTVHDVRVACRRLRSVLRTFAPFFPPELYARVDKSLKRFMKRFNLLRDLDVHLEIMQSLKIPHHPAGKEARATISHFTRKKKDLDRKLKEFMKGDIGLAGTIIPDVPEEFAAEINEKGAGILLPELAELSNRIDGVPWETPGETLVALHSLRIQIKRVRYGAEAFQKRLGIESAKLLERLKRLQDVLGWIHDCDTLGVSLQEFLLEEYRQKYRRCKDLVKAASWPVINGAVPGRLKSAENKSLAGGALFLLKCAGKLRSKHFQHARDLFATLGKARWVEALQSWFSGGKCPQVFRKTLNDPNFK